MTRSRFETEFGLDGFEFSFASSRVEASHCQRECSLASRQRGAKPHGLLSPASMAGNRGHVRAQGQRPGSLHGVTTLPFAHKRPSMRSVPIEQRPGVQPSDVYPALANQP